MIYLDSAATTLLKPPQVAQAVVRAMDSLGSAGRAGHQAAREASEQVFAARRAVSDLLGGAGPARVCFFANATQALNAAIAGTLRRGMRAVTTQASHNSVLRPLFRARDLLGVGLDVVRVLPDGIVDLGEFERALSGGADLAVLTHASNLTGDVYDVAAMARLAHEHGALVLLDAAQTAGSLPLDMAALGADMLAFTGHKALFGPQGTGGLVLAPGVEPDPVLVGGTGVQSFLEGMPPELPERLEAGTLNAHGIAGLLAGVEYVAGRGPDRLHEQTRELAAGLEDGVRAIPGVAVLGRAAGLDNCGTVALNVGEAPSSMVADVLDREFGVCTRAGAHCAPLMHQALGTRRQGAVRLSLCCLNTRQDVDAAVDALSQVARALGDAR